MSEYRYFLKQGDGPERPVTKAEYVAAERGAGFYNRLGQPDEPATGSFNAPGVSGRQVWTSEDQAWFWTPEWQAGEREAEEQAANDEGKTFFSGEGFLESLTDQNGPG